MSEITRMFDDQPVRIIEEDGSLWFVGKDVCKQLGYQNEADAMNRHCKGVVKRYPLLTDGGKQEVRVLSEPDVMRLICSSKLPAAVEFEKWVFEEILPSIRRNGQYSMKENGMQQRNNGTYISLEQLLRILDTNFDHESASYKDCINAILQAALFSSQTNQETAQDIPRLILDAICCGQLVIPGSQTPKPPVSDAKNTQIQESDPAPAEEAEHEKPFQFPKVALQHTILTHVALCISRMSKALGIISRIAAETGKHLTGVPIPTFDFEFPITVHTVTNLLNIEELAERMDLPPDLLERDARRYCANMPSTAFWFQPPSFESSVLPQISRYGLKYEKRRTLISHSGAILLAYLHNRYVEVQPSAYFGSDITLRKRALNIAIKKKKIVRQNPTDFCNASVSEIDKMLEPFGGYAKIIDENWKETF